MACQSASAAAVRIIRFGAAKGTSVKSMVMLTLGTGIGDEVGKKPMWPLKAAK